MYLVYLDKYLSDLQVFGLQFFRSLAVTPSQSRTMKFSEVTAICHDYTINGIHNMIEVANKPFRFVYVSGVLTERDQNKILPQMGEYLHLRVSPSSRSSLLAFYFIHPVLLIFDSSKNRAGLKIASLISRKRIL